MRTRDERGAAAVELALVIGGLVLLLGLLTAGGRVWWTRSVLADAAESAARAATLDERDGARVARRTLEENGLTCDGGPGVHVTRTRVGSGPAVTATVTCRVPFADLPLPGPDGHGVRARASAPVDRHRAGGGA